MKYHAVDAYSHISAKFQAIILHVYGVNTFEHVLYLIECIELDMSHTML